MCQPLGKYTWVHFIICMFFLRLWYRNFKCSNAGKYSSIFCYLPPSDHTKKSLPHHPAHCSVPLLSPAPSNHLMTLWSKVYSTQDTKTNQQTTSLSPVLLYLPIYLTPFHRLLRQQVESALWEQAGLSQALESLPLTVQAQMKLHTGPVLTAEEYISRWKLTLSFSLS